MSENTNSSEYHPSTSINENMLDNNYSNMKNSNIKNLNDNPSKTIIITKHLSEPCPVYYVDYFKSVNIICKDPSHICDKGTTEDKIDKRSIDEARTQSNEDSSKLIRIILKREVMMLG